MPPLINRKNNHSPNISVVMPVYNGARTLIESVDSVLKQTYDDFELIICNDASIDETENILKNITDTRVRVIHNIQNLGEGKTRDRAIELARGAWVAVIDADDTWAPERLEVMLREVDASTDKIIFDDIIECHDTPSGMVPWHVLRGKHAFGCNGTDSIDVPIETFVCSVRLLIKPLIPLSFIKQYHVHHTSRLFPADIEFFLKIFACGLKLQYVPKAMYHYRITPGSISATSNRSTFMREVLEKAINDFEHSPSIQNALQKKIAMVKCNEQYRLLFLSLKRNNFIEALQQVYYSPRMIPDSIPRVVRVLTYHVHRILHGGRTRGVLKNHK
jgi:succinoglycan biosynthesis protein ExoO